MSEAQKKIVIKKVSPYPFSAQLEAGAKRVLIEVRLITLTGLIADLKKAFVKVGEEYLVSLVLPVQGSEIKSQVKVMKTYDQLKDPKQLRGSIERMAEFHFLNMSPDLRATITNFLIAIKQK